MDLVEGSIVVHIIKVGHAAGLVHLRSLQMKHLPIQAFITAREGVGVKDPAHRLFLTSPLLNGKLHLPISKQGLTL